MFSSFVVGAEVDFYRGKILACRYFFRYELPKIEGISRTLKQSCGLAVDVSDDLFND